MPHHFLKVHFPNKDSHIAHDSEAFQSYPSSYPPGTSPDTAILEWPLLQTRAWTEKV